MTTHRKTALALILLALATLVSCEGNSQSKTVVTEGPGPDVTAEGADGVEPPETPRPGNSGGIHPGWYLVDGEGHLSPTDWQRAPRSWGIKSGLDLGKAHDECVRFEVVDSTPTRGAPFHMPSGTLGPCLPYLQPEIYASPSCVTPLVETRDVAFYARADNTMAYAGGERVYTETVYHDVDGVCMPRAWDPAAPLFQVRSLPANFPRRLPGEPPFSILWLE